MAEMQTDPPPTSRKPPDHPFRVGRWRADPSTNTLSDGDARVAVEPKVMDLLTLLPGITGQSTMSSSGVPAGASWWWPWSSCPPW